MHRCVEDRDLCSLRGAIRHPSVVIPTLIRQNDPFSMGRLSSGFKMDFVVMNNV